MVLARLCAIVGLDLSARAYPGGVPLRDARHARLLARFRDLLHAAIRWAIEVPLPIPGDQRAWDALLSGDDWRYGVEAELNPVDGQALLRRIALKRRDGLVNGVILLLPDTRQTRVFRREFASALAGEFPVPSRVAFSQLASGHAPGGNAVVVI